MGELIEKLVTDLELRALRWAERERAINIKLRKALKGVIDSIEAEPLAIGEPGESVQIGRLQVCDELRALLKEVRDEIALCSRA